ncbi:MAG: prepilin peptidase [Schleiferilactobacillus harbinensis]|nr:prepilin peptidase [Schleiferilactobacillus harbinensis]MCI1912599.1 prepilin peptidase [Schleiferilactobacillus harbinensis]
MLILWGTLTGACWGSFLLCRAWRTTQTVSQPHRSYCSSCKRLIHFYDNIPVLSYLLLRGRCRHCAAAIDPRFWLGELCGAASGGLIMTAALWQSPVLLLFLFLLSFLAASDLYHYAFDDRWFWLGTILCLLIAVATQHPLHWWAAFAAAAILILPVFWQKMGAGDLELITLATLIFGPYPILHWLLTASTLGLLIIFLTHHQKKPIPFLPILYIAALVVITAYHW